MKPTARDKLLTTAQAAALLDIAPSSIRRLTLAGILKPAISSGRGAEAAHGREPELQGEETQGETQKGRPPLSDGRPRTSPVHLTGAYCTSPLAGTLATRVKVSRLRCPRAADCVHSPASRFSLTV
jgi:hypothetical protein